MSKLTTLILSLALSSSVFSAPQITVTQAAIQQPIKTELFTGLTAEKAHDKAKAELFFSAAAQKRSGLAYLHLAKLIEKQNPSQAVHDDLMAAKYGYPCAYRHIGKLYATGIKHVKANAFLSECYKNAGRSSPSVQLVTLCTQQEGSNFVFVVNQGFQNPYENSLNAQKQYREFCNGANDELLNPRMHQNQRSALRALICQSPAPSHQATLKKGDLILRRGHVFEFTSGQFVPYSAPLLKGDIVYTENPPLTAYFYTGQKLKQMHSGAVVEKNDQQFVLDHNHFIPKKTAQQPQNRS